MSQNHSQNQNQNQNRESEESGVGDQGWGIRSLESGIGRRGGESGVWGRESVSESESGVGGRVGSLVIIRDSLASYYPASHVVLAGSVRGGEGCRGRAGCWVTLHRYAFRSATRT